MASFWDYISARGLSGAGAPFGVQSPQEDAQNPPGPLDKLVKGMGAAAWNGFTAPGNALNSTPDNPVTTSQMIAPAANLASMVTLGAGAAPAEANSVNMGIRAYHGSPYDFDKFDISKIGTGEGAQAYGHGLYFAENPGVAKAYKDMLAPGKGADPIDTAQRVLDHFNGDRQAAISELNTRLANLSNTTASSISPFGVQSITQAKQILESGQHIGGRMYEVNINADPAQFLDWDKPIGQQAQSLLTPERLAQMNQFNAKWKQPPVDPAKLTGEDFYSHLSQPVSGQPGNDLLASKQLQGSGVPGIKYLDAGSRAAGDGSRNYVVFNPSIIDILKKWGLAGMAGGGAATLGANTKAPMLNM